MTASPRALLITESRSVDPWLVVEKSGRTIALTRAGANGAGIPHCVLNSIAYRHCDLWERAILVELVLQMNGYNNGRIALSQRQISERLGKCSFKKIGRAIAGLMEKCLIDVSTEGDWKQRKAREYRLTFVNTGKDGRYQPATNTSAGVPKRNLALNVRQHGGV